MSRKENDETYEKEGFIDITCISSIGIVQFNSI